MNGDSQRVLNGRDVTPGGDAERDERRKRPKRRIGLEEISGDLATVQDICDWTGASKNTVYEWCRSGCLRDDVVRFGRQIRIPKKALAKMVEGES